jgi:hypothetical protein
MNMKNWPIFAFCILLGIYCAGLLQKRVHAQTATLWFSVNAGNVNCQASIISQTPSRISYKCSSPSGTSAGSYSSDPVKGPNGTNVISLMMADSMPANSNTFNVNNVSCLIAFNESAAPVAGIVNFGTIPANTAMYQCTTYESQNQGSAPWP